MDEESKENSFCGPGCIKVRAAGYLAQLSRIQSSKMNMSPMRHRILDGRFPRRGWSLGHRERLLSAVPGNDGYSSSSPGE
jgi:hypothetical protein